MAISASPPMDPLKVSTLRDRLSHWDIITRADAANQLTEMANTVDPEWIVTVCDKYWQPLGEVGQELIDLQGTDPRNQLPMGTMVCKADNRFLDAFMNCRNTMVGVIVETEGLRFPYYVVSHDWELKEGEWTSTCNLKGIWDVLNFYQIWPDPLFPIQAQIFSHAVFAWGLCTVVETMVAECALRIQSGWMELVNNALSLNPDFLAWFGTFLEENPAAGQMLKTPTYVVRTNPFYDESPLFVKTVRMESWGTVIADITKPYGVECRMDLWLPGDPQPDPYANLVQPTYVFSTKDRSQVTGPTQTVLDGVLRTVVDLEGSLLGSTLDPLLNPSGGNNFAPEGVFIAPSIGID